MPERRDDRRERNLAVAQLDALAHESARARAFGTRGELGDQPALADSRVARDEDHRRRPPGRALVCLFEGAQLVGAADKLWAGASRRHRAIIRSRRCGRGSWSRRNAAAREAAAWRRRSFTCSCAARYP